MQVAKTLLDDAERFIKKEPQHCTRKEATRKRTTTRQQKIKISAEILRLGEKKWKMKYRSALTTFLFKLVVELFFDAFAIWPSSSLPSKPWPKLLPPPPPESREEDSGRRRKRTWRSCPVWCSNAMIRAGSWNDRPIADWFRFYLQVVDNIRTWTQNNNNN